MRNQPLACLLLWATAACGRPETPPASAFSDIAALQVDARLAQPVYRVDSSAKFTYTVRNARPRAVSIYGPGCIVNVELRNLEGVAVFPAGVRPCLPPMETFRVAARDSVSGSVQMTGARGNSQIIGFAALPAGTFRMRVVLQGVSDTMTFNPVRVHSAWSDTFTVHPSRSPAR